MKFKLEIDMDVLGDSPDGRDKLILVLQEAAGDVARAFKHGMMPGIGERLFDRDGRDCGKLEARIVSMASDQIIGRHARWEASFERKSRIPGFWERRRRQLSWLEIIGRGLVIIAAAAVLVAAFS